MVKKILSPIYVGAFILLLMLGSLAHLMYGSCQTTKYHYMCQAYWMPDYLPGWMLVKIPYTFMDDPFLKNYSGVWRTWHKGGEKERIFNYQKGCLRDVSNTWYSNGTLSFSFDCTNPKYSVKIDHYFKNGKIWTSGYWLNGQREYVHRLWYENGIIKREQNWKKGRLLGSSKFWNKNGIEIDKNIFYKSFPYLNPNNGIGQRSGFSLLAIPHCLTDRK